MKRKYLILFFNGEVTTKLETIGAMVSRGLAFEYTGEYIRLPMIKERLLLELGEIQDTSELEQIVTFAYEEIDEEGNSLIKIVRKQ